MRLVRITTGLSTDEYRPKRSLSLYRSAVGLLLRRAFMGIKTRSWADLGDLGRKVARPSDVDELAEILRAVFIMGTTESVSRQLHSGDSLNGVRTVAA
jgi:hypothetical protein